MRKYIVSFLPLIIVFILVSLPGKAEIYVSPTGLDTNPGTIELPLLTLTKALTLVGPDSLIYLRGGTYSSSVKITISKNGTASHYIKIWAYPGEVPVFDFSTEPAGSTDGISLSGTYIHLKGLSMTKAAHNGLNVSGHYNIIEQCSFYDNRNSGYQMGSSSSTANPSNNLILNCDSYRNYDAATTGRNADGYAVKWNIGTGNVFKGCRAYNNSDDGWDLWMAINSVVIDSCMAFRNGINIWSPDVLSGNNGNGFKLGGEYIATPHTTRNCVSFDNAGDTGRGFDENNNTAGQTVYNCTAFRNTGDNFHFTNTVVSGQHVIKNCLSYQGVVNITSGTRTNNSWQGFTVTNADFRSFDTTLAVLPRDSNGMMQITPFLRLAFGSSLIDAGVDVGLPYNGSAPDLGAYEYVLAVPVYTLSTNAENGSISKNPGKSSYDSGMVVQVTAIPSTGYHFVNWSGDTSGTANPVSIIMNRNKSLTAIFGLNTYSCAVTTIGNGTVVKNPDQVSYDTASVVQLTAIPAIGYHFVGWSGDTSGSLNPLSIFMDSDKAITATFAITTYSLTIGTTGGGTVNKIPNQTRYDTGTVVILNAIPTPTFRFLGWSGDINGTVNPDTIIMDGDKNITADFSLDTTTISLDVRATWNMLSLPLTVFDPRKTAIYPTAVSDVFPYSGAYFRTDTIQNKIGYWLKFPSAQTITITGVIRYNDTIDVRTGWNMIGSLMSPQSKSEIVQIPDGIIQSSFYTFNGSYVGTDTLQPGKGYWVKVLSDGQLILSHPERTSSKQSIQKTKD